AGFEDEVTEIISKYDPVLIRVALELLQVESIQPTAKDGERVKTSLQSLHDSLPPDKNRIAIIANGLRELKNSIVATEVTKIKEHLRKLDRSKLKQISDEFLPTSSDKHVDELIYCGPSLNDLVACDGTQTPGVTTMSKEIQNYSIKHELVYCGPTLDDKVACYDGNVPGRDTMAKEIQNYRINHELVYCGPSLNDLVACDDTQTPGVTTISKEIANSPGARRRIWRMLQEMEKNGEL
ncbi:hypothetical protein ACFLSQ_10355, partial [Bacteroidota bacterium]